MKYTFVCCLAVALGLVLGGSPMQGGPPTGSLGGEVTDPSGAVVPKARVLVSSDHWSKTLSSGEAGEFVVSGLAPGHYEVVVISAGFAPFDRTDLVVSAGDTTEMNAVLDLPVLKQAITVAVAPAGAK